jgi:hypothetical protein
MVIELPASKDRGSGRSVPFRTASETKIRNSKSKSALISTEVDPPPREKRLGRNDAHLVLLTPEHKPTGDGSSQAKVIACTKMLPVSFDSRFRKPVCRAARSAVFVKTASRARTTLI